MIKDALKAVGQEKTTSFMKEIAEHVKLPEPLVFSSGFDSTGLTDQELLKLLVLMLDSDVITGLDEDKFLEIIHKHKLGETFGVK